MISKIDEEKERSKTDVEVNCEQPRPQLNPLSLGNPLTVRKYKINVDISIELKFISILLGIVSSGKRSVSQSKDTFFWGKKMVQSVKVFKKATPNGKVTFYLGRRDFIDHLDYCDPVDGVIVVEQDYLKGRRVYGQLVTTYRYGREEDEVMGVKFSKEMVLVTDQIVPLVNQKMEMTPTQEKLVRKLGENAYPFTFHFPPASPSSVVLQQEGYDGSKPLGIEYSIRAYVADSDSDRQHKRSMVTLVIKKLQYAPSNRGQRLPSSVVSKGFTFSNGKISLEVTLDREIYYHGEKIGATCHITNNSKKTVKNIKIMIVQHTEISMLNTQFSKHVASMETKEGCPITPGANLTKCFFMVPLASSNKDKHG